MRGRFNGDDSRVTRFGANPAIARREGDDGGGPYFPLKICLNKYTSLRMADETRHDAPGTCDRVSQLHSGAGTIRRVCRARESATFTEMIRLQRI